MSDVIAVGEAGELEALPLESNRVRDAEIEIDRRANTIN